MEWSMTSNVENKRASFMPLTWLESNSSDLLHSFNHYDPYAENIIDAYQCPSNSNDMVLKKKLRLTSEQIASLELSFQENIKLDSDKKLKLSKELGLQPRQVAVWFQNRRAREKVKHLEESYDSLRKEYEAVWREKQMLHDEVQKLRAIIRDQGLMKTQPNLDCNQIYGIGEHTNSRMIVASSFWPQISMLPYPW